jgi:hypothetical protein
MHIAVQDFHAAFGHGPPPGQDTTYTNARFCVNVSGKLSGMGIYPGAIGLAVPDMPVGSPGMEGGKPEPHEILTFDKSGRTTVYAKR